MQSVSMNQLDLVLCDTCQRITKQRLKIGATSLCYKLYNSVSEVFCCKNYTEWNLLPDSVTSHGFSIILQKTTVCYIKPVYIRRMHTPLP